MGNTADEKTHENPPGYYIFLTSALNERIKNGNNLLKLWSYTLQESFQGEHWSVWK